MHECVVFIDCYLIVTYLLPRGAQHSAAQVRFAVSKAAVGPRGADHGLGCVTIVCLGKLNGSDQILKVFTAAQTIPMIRK